MRIVSGSLRGKVIKAPDGLETRPTTDRVREALFSSLYSLRGGFEDAMVLDAFAGSGALGIEALSRGAAHAVFFEVDPKAHAVLKRNVESCGIEPARARIVRRDVMRTAAQSDERPFDLVFLDPPYAMDAGSVLSMVASVAQRGDLADDAIVVYEHALADCEDVARAAAENGMRVRASKKYGKTGVTILEPSDACGMQEE